MAKDEDMKRKVGVREQGGASLKAHAKVMKDQTGMEIGIGVLSYALTERDMGTWTS